VKIPKKIKLFGCDYEIRQLEQVDENDSNLGLCLVDEGVIKIVSSKSKGKKGERFSEQKRKQVLLHELVHLMFYAIGEEDLYENEKIVDNMANCLMEIIPQLEDKK